MSESVWLELKITYRYKAHPADYDNETNPVKMAEIDLNNLNVSGITLDEFLDITEVDKLTITPVEGKAWK